MRKKVIVLESCTKCEFFDTEPVYTADSFEHCEKWFCKKKKGLVISRFHETFDEDPGIPKECPLDDYSETK